MPSTRFHFQVTMIMRSLPFLCLFLTTALARGAGRPAAFNVFAPQKPTASILTNAKQIKEALLAKANAVNRGLTETEEDRTEILKLIQQLEKKNPTKRPVASPLISARWRLIYTTSDSILGKTRPAPFRPAGDILQIIDAEAGTVRNEESLRPVPFLPAIPEAIDATITPAGDTRVNVFFQKLQFGPVSFPFKSQNYLDVTYLDENVRVSRGGRGNVFVLVKD